MKPAPITLALTTGDPAGIGPEICAAAGQQLLNHNSQIRLHLYGDTSLFDHDFLNHPQVRLFHTPCAVPPIPGKPDAANAPYVTGLIEQAVAHVLSSQGQGQDQAQALVTAPIAKSVLYQAGFAFPGHTEFLGHLAGGVSTHMMLASAALRVVPITLHQSLKSAIEDLSQEKIIAAVRAAHQGLKVHFGFDRPRLVICGLNPHAGENGTMGREDEDMIRPAVQSLRGEGIDIRGPLPADTLFHAAARQTYDCALGLYHDQVLIPIKALAFDTGVNLTLGLPFVRTSPDHGTAFDIAGTGRASSSSLLAAMEMAAQMVAGAA